MNMERAITAAFPRNGGVHRVSAPVFPKLANKSLRERLLARNHARMWQLALKNPATQRAGGCFCYEDDIIFHTSIAYEFTKLLHRASLSSPPLHCVRFDSVPLVRIEDLGPDEMVSFPTFSWACVGACWYSVDFMELALAVLDESACPGASGLDYSWSTNETLLKHISAQLPLGSTRSTSPSLCLQEWFLPGNNNSSLQSDEHMHSLMKMMYGGYIQNSIHHYRLIMYDAREAELIKRSMANMPVPKNEFMEFKPA